MILHPTCTGMFLVGTDIIGVLDFGPSKTYPPALLRASGSEIWDAYECIRRIIPLLLYSVTASGCDAL